MNESWHQLEKYQKEERTLLDVSLKVGQRCACWPDRWFNPFLDQNLSGLWGGGRTRKPDTRDIFLRTLSCPLPSLWLTALSCFPPALMWAAIPHPTRHRGQRHLGTTEGSESFCKLLDRALRQWRRADSTSASWSHWRKWKPLSLSTAGTEFRQLCITCWLITHLSPFFKKKSQINNDWKLKICSWPLNTSKSLQLSPGLLVCNSYVPWILQRFN